MNNLEPIDFELNASEDEEHFDMKFDETPDDMELDFGETSDLGTRNFDELNNRPSYGGETMTHATNIPKIEIDDMISDNSKNPVENRAISRAMGTKVDADELSMVAKTGKYEDLEGEPGCFTSAEWERLWATY